MIFVLLYNFYQIGKLYIHNGSTFDGVNYAKTVFTNDNTKEFKR